MHAYAVFHLVRSHLHFVVICKVTIMLIVIQERRGESKQAEEKEEEHTTRHTEI